MLLGYELLTTRLVLQVEFKKKQGKKRGFVFSGGGGGGGWGVGLGEGALGAETARSVGNRSKGLLTEVYLF